MHNEGVQTLHRIGTFIVRMQKQFPILSCQWSCPLFYNCQIMANDWSTQGPHCILTWQRTRQFVDSLISLRKDPLIVKPRCLQKCGGALLCAVYRTRQGSNLWWDIRTLTQVSLVGDAPPCGWVILGLLSVQLQFLKPIEKLISSWTVLEFWV